MSFLIRKVAEYTSMSSNKWQHTGAREDGKRRDLRCERFAREKAETEATVPDGWTEGLCLSARVIFNPYAAVHNLVQVERFAGARPATGNATRGRLPIVVPHPNRHCKQYTGYIYIVVYENTRGEK